jgi:gamma-glutamyltranspeptidase/glutathione hydrolase
MEGRPFMTIGTPGGSRIIGALAQIILNIVEFQMNIDEAIEAPRIHAYKETLHVEGRISEAIIEDLKKRGHTIKIHQNYDNYFGGAQGILVDPQTGELHGGADSRRDGAAIGY